MAPKQNYLAKQLTTNKTLAPPPTHIDKITPHTQVLLSQQIKRAREGEMYPFVFLPARVEFYRSLFLHRERTHANEVAKKANDLRVLGDTKRQ